MNENIVDSVETNNNKVDYITPTFYISQPFRDFLEENLDVDEFVRFLLTCKGMYGSFKRLSAQLESSPPRRVMSQLFWSRYLTRSSVSKQEFQVYLQTALKSYTDGSVCALEFPFESRRTCLYFYFDGSSCNIKYIYDLDESVMTGDDFYTSLRENMDAELVRNIWLWLSKKNLVGEDNRLHCRMVRKNAEDDKTSRKDIYDDAFICRLKFATPAHLQYLQNPIEKTENNTNQSYYRNFLTANTMKICNEEVER